MGSCGIVIDATRANEFSISRERNGNGEIWKGQTDSMLETYGHNAEGQLDMMLRADGLFKGICYKLVWSTGASDFF
jgi:hypothetical protein